MPGKENPLPVTRRLNLDEGACILWSGRLQIPWAGSKQQTAATPLFNEAYEYRA